MDESYASLLEFLNIAEKLKSTLRHNWMTSGRQEDAAEHSWRAAVFFIIANELFEFDVDPYKTLVMLIFHDLPEAIFGDIPAFVKDTDLDKHTRHKLREEQATKEIFSVLPKPLDSKYIKLIKEFESGESNEARAAKAIEKIESQLQHQESGPKYWSDEEKGDHMLHYPDGAIKKLGSKDIEKIWKIIYDRIYKDTYSPNKKSV